MVVVEVGMDLAGVALDGAGEVTLRAAAGSVGTREAAGPFGGVGV